MNKKLNLLVMLASLLALSSVLIGCPTDSDDGGGAIVAAKYQGTYTPESPSDGDWTLIIKERTLEIRKLPDGPVKTLTVAGVTEETAFYRINVPPVATGHSGGTLTFFWEDDGTTIRTIETNSNGPFENYPNDTERVDTIPHYWEK
jgi:hypothetical protein